MNVKELIEQLKCRPEMFVGERNMTFIFHFINGFLYCKMVAGQIEAVETVFNEIFSNWIKKELESQCQIGLDDHRNYLFYFSKCFTTEKEKLDVFFNLTEKFFKEKTLIDDIKSFKKS